MTNLKITLSKRIYILSNVKRKTILSITFSKVGCNIKKTSVCELTVICPKSQFNRNLVGRNYDVKGTCRFAPRIYCEACYVMFVRHHTKRNENKNVKTTKCHHFGGKSKKIMM